MIYKSNTYTILAMKNGPGNGLYSDNTTLYGYIRDFYVVMYLVSVRYLVVCISKVPMKIDK